MNPFLMQATAWAQVTGATGAATAARGCATSRTGAGDYNLTLDVPIDATQGIVLALVRVADHTVYVVHTSDTVKQVLTRTLVPAAGDANFEAVVLKLS